MSTNRCQFQMTRRSLVVQCSPHARDPLLGVKPSVVEGVRSRYSPSSLAFLGDAVWEAFLRVHEFPPLTSLDDIPTSMHPTSLHDYNKAVKRHSSAVQQAILHDKAIDPSSTEAFSLTEEEADILRWAGNSSTVSPPRGVPAGVYKKATALEALVAYLYLTDEARCNELMIFLVGQPTVYRQTPIPSSSWSSKQKRAKDNKSWS